MKTHRGFILIEVLLVGTVLSILLLSVTTAFSGLLTFTQPLKDPLFDKDTQQALIHCTPLSPEVTSCQKGTLQWHVID